MLVCSCFILITSQILNIEHLEYVISFIDAKVKRVDDAKKKHQGIGALPTVVTSKESSHFHLGSPAKVEEELSKLTNSAGSPIFNLPNLLETYINKFRTEEEGYYRVQKEHMVLGFPSH